MNEDLYNAPLNRELPESWAANEDPFADFVSLLDKRLLETAHLLHLLNVPTTLIAEAVDCTIEVSGYDPSIFQAHAVASAWELENGGGRPVPCEGEARQ